MINQYLIAIIIKRMKIKMTMMKIKKQFQILIKMIIKMMKSIYYQIINLKK